jgi:hypothetical protein
VRSVVAPALCALAVSLAGCPSAPRGPDHGPPETIRTGLMLSLDGGDVVTATWISRGGTPAVSRTSIERAQKAGAGTAKRVGVVEGKARAMAITPRGEVVVARIMEQDLLLLPPDGTAPRVISKLADLKSIVKHQFTGVAVAGSELLFSVDTGYETFDDAESDDDKPKWNPSLFAVPLAGGAPREISDRLGVHDLVVDGADVYATVCVVAIDYPSEGGIARIPIAGGEVTTLASGEVADGACPTSLAVDETHVYWLLRDAVHRIPKGRSKVETLARVGGASALALDKTNIYVAGHDEIVMMPKPGEGDEPDSPKTISPANDAVAIAVDDTTVYWLEERGTGYRRLPKPQ